MTRFDLGYTNRGEGDWPATPPQLSALALPPRLRVPLAGRELSPRRAGDELAAAEPLVNVPGEQWPLPLAPARGRIVASTHVQLTNARSAPAVELDCSAPQADLPEADVAPSALELVHSAQPAELPAWIDRFRHGGIWADRLCSPDLIGQLHQLLRRPVDTVICNLLDEDPAVRLNSALAATHPIAVLLGVGLLARLSGARKLWLVIEGGSPGRWWAALRRHAPRVSAQIIPLRNDYPQPDPTLLLYRLTRRRLRPRRLPTDVGTLLLDAAAALALGQWIALDRPMLRMPLALFHHARGQAHYLSVPVGMALTDVLAAARIPAQRDTLRAGHPLRDIKLDPQAVVGGGGELTLHATFRQTPEDAQPCIRCAWCVEGCPVRIQPAGLLEAAQHDDPALAKHFGLEACIECGLCSYVCPSHLPLLDAVRKLRGGAKSC